jgi:hypothetical protein
VWSASRWPTTPRTRVTPFVIDKRLVDRGDKQGLQSVDLLAPDEAGEYVLFIFRVAAGPQPVAHFAVGK